MSTLLIRNTTPSDSRKIAGLHAVSWRSAYRGLLSDDYLDKDLDGERQKYWHSKMQSLLQGEFVLIAEDNGDAVGFIAVMNKPENGYDALIDNLHVLPHLKGRGVGGKLMKAAAERMKADGRSSTYLWVLHGNDSAAAFYTAKNGIPADEAEHDFGGKRVGVTRFVWNNLDLLLQ